MRYLVSITLPLFLAAGGIACGGDSGNSKSGGGTEAPSPSDTRIDTRTDKDAQQSQDDVGNNEKTDATSDGNEESPQDTSNNKDVDGTGSDSTSEKGFTVTGQIAPSGPRETKNDGFSVEGHLTPVSEKRMSKGAWTVEGSALRMFSL